MFLWCFTLWLVDSKVWEQGDNFGCMDAVLTGLCNTSPMLGANGLVLRILSIISMIACIPSIFDLAKWWQLHLNACYHQKYIWCLLLLVFLTENWEVISEAAHHTYMDCTMLNHHVPFPIVPVLPTVIVAPAVDPLSADSVGVPITPSIVAWGTVINCFLSFIYSVVLSMDPSVCREVQVGCWGLIIVTGLPCIKFMFVVLWPLQSIPRESLAETVLIPAHCEKIGIYIMTPICSGRAWIVWLVAGHFWLGILVAWDIVENAILPLPAFIEIH